jgi:hypothetical protein
VIEPDVSPGSSHSWSLAVPRAPGSRTRQQSRGFDDSRETTHLHLDRYVRAEVDPAIDGQRTAGRELHPLKIDDFHGALRRASPFR